jgi:hypothetical protein
MGTNFYARVIPIKERKDTLKELIDNNDFPNILHQTHEMYDSFRPYSMDDSIQGLIHLGKRSGGWKFLWNPNIYQIRNGHSVWIDNGDGSKFSKWVVEPDTAYYVYPLTKKGIKAFIDRPDIEIYDEYGEKQDKDDFFKEAIEWTTWNGHEAWDADSYNKKYPKERKFSCENEYTDFLESLGYKLSEYKSDFYSDGLRFSTATDFC